MSSNRAVEDALGRCCESARQLLDPRLNAAAIEAAVLERVARSNADSSVVRRRRPVTSYLRVAGALAAAAGFAFLGWHIAGRAQHSGERVTRVQPREEPSVDGTRLTLGQTIQAVEHDVTVTHPNVATWRLRAPGVARVVENGSRITLSLEEGHIDASVVPRPQPEVLAIEVERLRVAVHGTVFSVDRQGDSAVIQVHEGSVRVGSVDERGTSAGRLLTAPSRLSVAFRELGSRDSAPSDQTPSPRSANASVPKLRASAELSVHPNTEPPPSSTPSERATAPSTVEAERILEASMRSAAECFASQTGADPNVRVSFGTRIQVRVAPDGSVSLAGFDPPVPRDVFACAQREVTKLRTAKSDLGAFLSRPQVLTR